MNIIQENLTFSKTKIDIKNKYISGSEFKILTCKDPNEAFNQLKETLTNQMKFQITTIKKSLDKPKKVDNPDDKDELTNQFSIQFSNKDNLKKSNTEDHAKTEETTPINKDEQESKDYRSYLDKNGFKDSQAFSWTQIKGLINQQLNILEDKAYSKKLMKLFNELSDTIINTKNKYALKEAEILKLRNVKLKKKINNNSMQEFKGIDMKNYFDNPSQSQLIDLENEDLHSRIEQCEYHKPSIERLIKSNLEKLQLFTNDTLTFHPVKDSQSSIHQLHQYQKHSKQSGKSLYNLTDLLSCSVVTRSPEDTCKVVECLEAIKEVNVVDIKNGFDSKAPTEGAGMNKGNSMEIILVLKVNGDKLHMRQDELIEVHIIQEINFKVNQFYQKINEILEIEERVVKKIEHNAIIKNQFKTFMTTWNKDAYDYINGSEINQLRVVKDRLAEQVPENHYEDLNTEQILNCRYGWRDSKFEQMYDRLEILNIAKGSFELLKIELKNNKYEIDFKIDYKLLNKLQKEQFKKSRNYILEQDDDFISKLYSQIADWGKQICHSRINTISVNKMIYFTCSNIVNKFCSDTGSIIDSIKHNDEEVTCLALSNDEKYLQFGNKVGQVEKYDTSIKENLLTFKHHTTEVTSLILSSDGLQLYSVNDTGEIVKQHTLTRDLVSQSNNNKGRVTSIMMSLDGRFLFAGCNTEILKQDTNDLKNIAIYRHQKSTITFLTLDGQQLYSSSSDGVVKQNLQTGEKLLLFNQQSARVTSIVLSLDGLQLYTGIGNGEVIKQESHQLEVIMTQKHHEAEITNLSLSPDGQQLYTVSKDGILVKQSTSTYRLIEYYKNHSNTVRCLAWNSNKQYIYSGSSDKSVVKQECSNLKKISSYNHHSNSVFCIALSSDDKYLYSGCKNKIIVKQDTATTEKLLEFKYHHGGVNCLVLSPSNDFLFSGSENGDIVKQDTNTGELLQQLQPHKHWVLCLAISSDGKQLYSGGNDNCIFKQDTYTLKKLETYRHHKGGVSSLVLSKDGQQLFSSSLDFSIVKKNTISKQLVFRYHSFSEVISIALYNEVILAASYDGIILMFHNETGAFVKSIDNGGNKIISMIVNENEKTLQLGHNNGDLSSQELYQ